MMDVNTLLTDLYQQFQLEQPDKWSTFRCIITVSRTKAYVVNFQTPYVSSSGVGKTLDEAFSDLKKGIVKFKEWWLKYCTDGDFPLEPKNSKCDFYLKFLEEHGVV